jgi:aryl-alcohol dehydrogenase-like predicted oxidoreductase
MHIPGYATPEGTTRFAKRHAGRAADDHFRLWHGLLVSSIGVGTYLGECDDADDARYAAAIEAALRGGINLIDTAINYRCQRSERVIGQVVRRLIEQDVIARDEIIVSTKGGFLPFDGAVPEDPTAYFVATYVRPGLLAPGDVAAGCHCMSPRYLHDQIERSRANLGFQSVDLYYLHNPEMQLEEAGRSEVKRRIEEAFACFEGEVAAGTIRRYGTATWDAYRVSPEDASYLSLGEVIGIAHHVGGGDHHLAAIQLPYNLAMPEAAAGTHHLLDGESVSAVALAKARGIGVFCSASILQGRLSRNLPAWLQEAFPELASDAQRALQFVRSTPGVTAALVGMKRVEHVEETLAVAATPPADISRLEQLLKP